MNMYMHKNCWNIMLKWDFELEYAHTNIYHAQMQLFNIHSYNYMSCTAELACIPLSIHLTCSSFSLTENIVAELKMDKITYLMMKSFRNQLRHCNVPPNHRPACSLISQQRCHPRAGHDSPRIKGTSRLTHSQVYINIAKPTQLGLSVHPGVGKS